MNELLAHVATPIGLTILGWIVGFPSPSDTP
jgi:hypothetical protein